MSATTGGTIHEARQESAPAHFDGRGGRRRGLWLGASGVNTKHVDLWMGGDKNSTSNPEKSALLACEDKWTRTTTVILNPPSNEPVDTTALFTPPTTCHGGTGD
jgi:hypothetical protein